MQVHAHVKVICDDTYFNESWSHYPLTPPCLLAYLRPLGRPRSPYISPLLHVCTSTQTCMCVYTLLLSPPTFSLLLIYLIPSHGYAQPAPRVCGYCRNPTSLAPLLGGMSARVLFKLLSIIVLLSRPPGRSVNQPTMNTGPSPSMLWFLSVMVSVSSSLVTAGCSAIE